MIKFQSVTIQREKIKRKKQSVCQKKSKIQEKWKWKK